MTQWYGHVLCTENNQQKNREIQMNACERKKKALSEDGPPNWIRQLRRLSNEHDLQSH